MKKTIFIISFLSIIGCAPIEKIKLPINTDKKVEYTRQIKCKSNKAEIYEKIIKWVAKKYSVKEVQQQSKTDGIISVVGREKYLYSGREKMVGYKLIISIDDNSCSTTITNINIKNGKHIELYYDKYVEMKSFGPTVEKLTGTFKSINGSLTEVLNRIENELTTP